MDIPLITKWPLDITVFEERAGNPVEFHDKARRIVNNDGKVQFKLKKRKFTIKPQQYSHIVLDMSKGRGHLYLWSTSPHEYVPVSWEKALELQVITKEQYAEMIKDNVKGNYQVVGFPKVDMKPIDENQRQWLVHRYRNAIERLMKQSPWEKYLPIISIIVLIIGGAILFTVVGSQIVDVTKQVSQVSGSNAQILEHAEKILRAVGTPGLPGVQVPPA